jgi:hypothetical protein
MSKIFTIKRSAAPSAVTMKFKSYNAAIEFANKSGMMKASKPYKRMLTINGEIVPVWCVSMPNLKPQKAQIEILAVKEIPAKKPQMHTLQLAA